ncbi:serine/glycine hydroxymethyltransferase [Chlamydia felis Fe/C-56]|uniref:Serine hydroxymethyltransferase n=1 Tax=Chlamydia felis (strain Fe/C-56) TaxID=264202 RepID=GLYA_CHLFF|nr:glycine hydroxymethyltransferase [Chlamydia felis]Q253I4.1 RecName: Full=Serine hydroxymethyltransferase; Short=SHMT; Short=Serine methylase [Chlamydia felis Fe/C-56]BAE81554.1 serine/glycine hydroxymethyltransferase [Chlamydia felis Fe/C-56]
MASLLHKFLENASGKKGQDLASTAYLAALDHLLHSFPSIGKSVIDELKSQRSRLKMIASENYSSISVQLAMGNLLTDKYCEGSPFKRFYSCCENVDAIEWECAETAKELFGAESAFVQPHSGADANLLAIMAIITQKIQGPAVKRLGYKTINDLTDKEYAELKAEIGSHVCLGPSLNSGGHLTHGNVRLNVMSKLMRCLPYEVSKKTELFDYAEIARLVRTHKPTVLIAGYSSYSRRLNFSILKQIADDCGAVLWVDMAHFAGLVAGGVFVEEENPIPFADIVTTTTHKTLRGPRGGLMLSTKEYEGMINRACPLMMGGPLPHVIAAKAIALKEALTVDFKKYAHQVVDNARTLAEHFQKHGLRLLTGGTDNHMLIIDLTSLGIPGNVAEDILSSVGIAVNRNTIPSDSEGVWRTSGIRLGTPALTSLGMGSDEMEEVANIIVKVLRNITLRRNADDNFSKSEGELPENIAQEAKARVADLLARFPLYPEIDLETLV